MKFPTNLPDTIKGKAESPVEIGAYARKDKRGNISFDNRVYFGYGSDPQQGDEIPYPNNNEFGMVYDASSPSMTPSDSVNFIQVLTGPPTIEYYDGPPSTANKLWEVTTTETGMGLDTQVKYDLMHDSPTVPVQERIGAETVLGVKVYQEFKTYLVCRVDSDAVWVPAKVFTWSWQAEGHWTDWTTENHESVLVRVPDAEGMAFSGSSNPEQNSEVTGGSIASFPEWDWNITELTTAPSW